MKESDCNCPELIEEFQTLQQQTRKGQNDNKENVKRLRSFKEIRKKAPKELKQDLKNFEHFDYGSNMKQTIDQSYIFLENYNLKVQ